MILPVLKFLAFTLAPFVILLLTTAPDLWSQFLTSARLMGTNPYSLLHLPGEILVLGETIVKGLTCDDLDFSAVDNAVPAPSLGEMLVSTPPSLEVNHLSSHQAPVELPSAHIHTPWLFARLALMGLNAYFPWLSPVSSLLSPLQATIPVLHWEASWWFTSLGWEPNIVSLAPLSHSYNQIHKLIVQNTMILIMAELADMNCSYQTICILDQH
ncbi:hypothetical protein DSO57_1000346 [Entomophthora muscae]|uniref:Uncharacterized protein n=1 Tax=Entomophthora muscae TaxID=34485 RepID=A0ACC2TK70_9FUNG|nr:hypothetical protein DSO57_1000346 [Entomophthora muscae]